MWLSQISNKSTTKFWQFLVVLNWNISQNNISVQLRQSYIRTQGTVPFTPATSNLLNLPPPWKSTTEVTGIEQLWPCPHSELGMLPRTVTYFGPDDCPFQGCGVSQAMSYQTFTVSLGTLPTWMGQRRASGGRQSISGVT